MYISQKSFDFVEKCEQNCTEAFIRADEICFKNQLKVLSAFQKNRVQARHFYGTTGYGYDDIGRDNLAKVFADVFHTEAAIVSPLITNGTHALTLVLFGLLRPGDTVLSATGDLYDTLHDVLFGDGNGSLKEFGISFVKVELTENGLDEAGVLAAVAEKKPKVVFFQRSRGYSWRNALTTDEIGSLAKKIKKIAPEIIVAVDNCYGEFVEEKEPTDVGADVVAGSLIKNAGGGLAPSGAYIAGTKKAVELIGYRLTSPSLGTEVGSYTPGYLAFYEGLFLAPNVVRNALKGSVLLGEAFEKMGYDTMPKSGGKIGDIIRSVKFDTADELVKFCQAIQEASPVDSDVVPEPWDMPGYEDKVIMAAGTFVQGSSVELSADGPIRPPYTAYMQGGLTYEHVKIATANAVEKLLK